MQHIGEKRSRNDLDILTINDILSSQKALEDEANEKIKEHWGIEGICTFIQGYKTQNIYSCLTCQNNNNNKDMFGFCYGCSMQCHIDHDIVELFSKRMFRCDCGLNKCGKCELDKKSDNIENTNNIYNHNFKGLYCFCNKTYNPDKDEMLQCYFCQDWFHVNCIEENTHSILYPNDKINRNTDNDNDNDNIIPFKYLPIERDDINMICSNCMNKYSFLKNYHNLQVFSDTLLQYKQDYNNNNNSLKCIIEERKQYEDKIPNFTTFWNPMWRKNLCYCDLCCKYYKELTIYDILQEDDNIHQDDNSDNIIEPSIDLEEIGMKELQNQVPDASQQLDLMQGFNMLSNELKLFLAPLAENGITVTKEHIESFFEMMKQKKRKLE